MSGQAASSTAIANCPCRCPWKAAGEASIRRKQAARRGRTWIFHSGTVMAPAAFHLRNRTFPGAKPTPGRSEEHTSELQSLMRISYAVFCLKKKKQQQQKKINKYNNNSHNI